MDDVRREQLQNNQGLSPESQGQNLALTVLYVPHSPKAPGSPARRRSSAFGFCVLVFGFSYFGFRVSFFGFRVPYFGVRVSDSGFGVWSLEFGVWGLGFQGLGSVFLFRISDFAIQISGIGLSFEGWMGWMVKGWRVRDLRVLWEKNP